MSYKLICPKNKTARYILDTEKNLIVESVGSEQEGRNRLTMWKSRMGYRKKVV